MDLESSEDNTNELSQEPRADIEEADCTKGPGFSKSRQAPFPVMKLKPNRPPPYTGVQTWACLHPQ